MSKLQAGAQVQTFELTLPRFCVDINLEFFGGSGNLKASA